MVQLLGGRPAIGQFISTFLVIAHTEQDDIFFTSEPATGYSVDNLAPPIPQQMTANHGANEILTEWVFEPVEDFSHHNITTLFSGNSTSTDTFMIQTISANHEEVYINSQDYNGNISNNSLSSYTKKVNSGANLISFNVLPVENSITNVMKSIEGIATGVIGQGVAANYIEGNGWMGSLSTIQPNSGYWIIVTEDDILLLKGEPTERNNGYLLEAGANLISYPFRYATAIEDAIPTDAQASITGIIGEGVAANNINGNWMGSLSHLEGSKGYWFITSNDVEFTFNGCDNQECAELSREGQYPSNGSKPYNELEGYNYNQSTQQAFYFIDSIEGIQIGDWILAYNGNELVGTRQWTGDYTDIPTMGDDGSNFTQGYMTRGNTPQFKILTDGGLNLKVLQGDIPFWSPNELFVVGSLREAAELPTEFEFGTAYPNPFNPVTNINYALPNDSEISISVFDLQGREVVTLVNGNRQAGYHSVKWNADSFSSGMYLVKMVTSNFSQTQKVLLLK